MMANNLKQNLYKYMLPCLKKTSHDDCSALIWYVDWDDNHAIGDVEDEDDVEYLEC